MEFLSKLLTISTTTSLLLQVHLANRKLPTTIYTESLTRRERDVLSLIVVGLTNEQIGNRLFLSPLTIKTHRANMLSKLNCNNTAALVKHAIDKKLLEDCKQ